MTTAADQSSPPGDAPVVVRGGSFAPNRQATGLDLGARLSLFATWHAARWLSPQLTLEALALPLRSTLVVNGRPDLGDLPTWYLGASLGVAWRFPGSSATVGPTPP